MYLLLARATSRIVWPGLAAMTSPSMRTFTFWVKPGLLSSRSLRMSQRRQRDVSSMAATGVEAERDLGARLHPLGGRAPRRARGGRLSLGFSGGSIAYSNSGQSEAKRFTPHEPLVDVAGGLLAVAHGVRDVRGAGDEVAAGVEALAAGLERVAVHLDACPPP